ncbi:hypothetical protein H8959_008332 [Pygathrix nigripes]
MWDRCFNIGSALIYSSCRSGSSALGLAPGGGGCGRSRPPPGAPGWPSRRGARGGGEEGGAGHRGAESGPSPSRSPAPIDHSLDRKLILFVQFIDQPKMAPGAAAATAAPGVCPHPGRPPGPRAACRRQRRRRRCRRGTGEGAAPAARGARARAGSGELAAGGGRRRAPGGGRGPAVAPARPLAPRPRPAVFPGKVCGELLRGVKRLPLQEEPPPLPPARRSWGWWRCGAAGSGEDLSLRGLGPPRERFGETWRGAAGVPRAQCRLGRGVPDCRVRAREEEAATFPERRPRAVPPGARIGDAASPPPVRAEIAARLGAPAAPSDLRRPFPSLPPLGASALTAGPAMERAAGALGDAFSGRVLESRAAGARWDPGVPGGGQGAESPAPRGDCAGAPRPTPEPPLCPGGECPPAIPRPEERRALRVRPARASSAPAAPGQPRDSARWMLCVAGAKLKLFEEGPHSLSLCPTVSYLDKAVMLGALGTGYL